MMMNDTSVVNTGGRPIRIGYQYGGPERMYTVLMDDEAVYHTKDRRDMDMFIAELKARIKIFGQGH